jgi:AcrR family transcriptional regulator
MKKIPFDIKSLKPHRSVRVLKAAEELILSEGYSGMSLDAVVEKAGCSKSTVYEFFGSKEGLLVALLEDFISEFQEQIEQATDSGKPLEIGLRDYARLILKRILSDRHMSLVRAILNESERSPTLARTYYDAGPRTGLKQVIDYLDKKGSSDGLAFDDSAQAASTFYSMIYTHVYARLFDAEKSPSEAETDKEADRIINLFTKLYKA